MRHVTARDLAARNIAMSDDLVPKISNFEPRGTDYFLGGGLATQSVRWMAPECAVGDSYFRLGECYAARTVIACGLLSSWPANRQTCGPLACCCGKSTRWESYRTVPSPTTRYGQLASASLAAVRYISINNELA